MKEKIAFLVSGKKIVENIKKYLDDDEILVVETSLNNSVEEAKKMVENGVKIILTKLAIKMKIEEEIDVPILCVENNISDYIELLSEINIKNKKVAFVDYIEYPASLISLSKIISENIVFKNFYLNHIKLYATCIEIDPTKKIEWDHPKIPEDAKIKVIYLSGEDFAEKTREEMKKGKKTFVFKKLAYYKKGHEKYKEDEYYYFE